jgi:L-malate glycosyltransferase
MTTSLNTVREEIVSRPDCLPVTPHISTSGHRAVRPVSATRRIRVLHLIDTLNIGGTENQMVHVALRMHRDGHQVTVCCLRAEGPLLRLLQAGGVPVVEFPKKKTLIALNGARQLLRLAAFLRSERFEVIHAHDLWANLVGIPAGRLARIPVVISSRRYLADLEWYTPWRNRVVRLIYRLSTRVVVNSQAICERLIDRERVAPDKIRIVYNGVDVERFACARLEREKLLPNVGKRSKLIAVLANMYSRVKGHACLLSAARIVCKNEAGAVFLLIGDGPERSRLETQVRDAGLDKNIVFAGRRTDVPELLACCDLSVLASEAEGFPNALLESMSAGLAVVATAVGGSKEIVENGVNGVLVPPGDPEALAAAILRLIHEPRLAMNLALAGQKDMRTRFSFDRLLADLDQLYREPLPS